MFRTIRKSLLVLGTVALLAPVLSLAEPNSKPCATAVGCAAVPEGGSGAEYLAALGTICLGGLILGARLRKRRTS